MLGILVNNASVCEWELMSCCSAKLLVKGIIFLSEPFVMGGHGIVVNMASTVGQNLTRSAHPEEEAVIKH